jgi:pentatricopeptide repeat protein
MPPKRSGRQPAGLREIGLRAFQNGRLSDAIATWQPFASEPAVARALAEAHFRRALGSAAHDPAGDLRRAAALSPADLRFPFHLGRLLHRAGDRVNAAAQYRAVLERDPRNTAAARLLALLSLELAPQTDLSGLPGMTPALRDWAAPARALLDRRPPPADDSPLGTFWRGLGLLAAGDPAAREALADERPLPASRLQPLRRYYRGVAAARAGDVAGAFALWQQVYDAGDRPAGLEGNLAALMHEQLARLVEEGDVVAAGGLAHRWADLAGGAAFDELRIQALDRAAAAEAAADEWERAAVYWDKARQILARAQGLGSPGPLLHNLALAYERAERWEDAADAWRALLRTRPRRGPAREADAQNEARWGWVRKRIITCYREADRPDEAVAVFRQMIKLDPDDLDLRLELADALLANEQERAAQNEVRRILELDPYHPEAAFREAAFLSQRWQFAEAQELVRAVAERHPGRADVRRLAAEVFLNHGRAHAQYGQFAAAYQDFVEGEGFDPENPRFPINQARMLNLLRRPSDTAALIERAITVAGGNNETWVLAIETWLQAGKLDEARALLERFERERTPGPEDYVTLGVQLLAEALQPLAPDPFGGLPALPPVATPEISLAVELFHKAVALRPDDRRILLAVTTFLMVPRPDLAGPFVDLIAERLPDDVEAQIVRGAALALAGQDREAKATLQRAAKLARQQALPDLREQAEELRRAVGTPMLRMMLTGGFGGFDDLDDMDDLDLDELFD